MKVVFGKLLFLVFSLLQIVQCRPQSRVNLGSRNNPVGGFRPIINNVRNQAPTQPNRRPPPPSPAPQQPTRPISLPKPPNRVTPTSALSPAFAPPNLYVAPIFDEFGNTLNSIEDYQDYIEYDDYEEYSDDYEDPLPPRPRLPRPPNSNLGPDLQPKLPNFNNVDILDATEALRSRDKNQISILNPGEVNAGILPLAFENPTALNLFPPLINPNP